MDKWLLAFAVVQFITIVASIRLYERVYTMRHNVQSKATKFLFDSWLVACAVMLLSAIFWMAVIFGGRLWPEVAALIWYRPTLVVINAIIQIGTLVALEIAWRRFMR